MLQIKNFIKEYIESGKTIIDESFETYLAEQEALRREKEGETYTGDEGEIVARIKELIDTYVKPAVATDGGNIEFESFDDGGVSVLLQGACSGCPSDRKSTRLNSSHVAISYAVFCLKKKKKRLIDCG